MLKADRRGRGVVVFLGSFLHLLYFACCIAAGVRWRVAQQRMTYWIRRLSLVQRATKTLGFVSVIFEMPIFKHGGRSEIFSRVVGVARGAGAR
jgi:hypothetical protein